MTEFPLKRRDLLRATGAVLLGTVGVSYTTGAQGTSGGDLIWAFTQPSGPVESSPTVADGTVYVGSGGFGDGDGTLYAVDAGVEGSSEGSRVELGTLGSLGSQSGESGSSGGDGFGPGFGPGVVLAGLSGAGYLLKQRASTDETDSS